MEIDNIIVGDNEKQIEDYIAELPKELAMTYTPDFDTVGGLIGYTIYTPVLDIRKEYPFKLWE